MKKLQKVVSAGAVFAMGIGLIGTGVRASLTDSVTGSVSAAVGTFGCKVSSTDPNTVVSGDGKSVTINLPPILASGAGNSYVQDLTVTNTGSMPQTVHWTFATGGTLAANQWQGSGGAMGYATGTVANNMTTDIVLAGLASKTYGTGKNGVGFLWAGLDNTYLGKSASVTYTANCGEQPASKIQFIGAADAAIATGSAPKASSVVCPTGTPSVGLYPHVGVVGSYSWCGTGAGVLFPVAATTGFPSSGTFTVSGDTVSYTGTTATAFTGVALVTGSPVAVAPVANDVVGAAPTTPLPLPGGWAVGDTAIAVSYGTGDANPTGFATPGYGFGSNIYGPSVVSWKVLATGDQNITIASGKGTNIAVAVYRNVATVGAFWVAGDPGSVALAIPSFPAGLKVTTGSSWVVGVIGTSHANVVSTNYSGMTGRGSFTGTGARVVDTNGGVSAWPGATGGPVAEGSEWAVELESA